jgi:tetratricopeptide (TPR) repeat protein
MATNGQDFFNTESETLDTLAMAFEKALDLRREGQEKRAELALHGILQIEPRLAEPRLELAHFALARGEADEAEEQARLAIETLRAGGQWTLDLPANRLLAYALNLLGEALSQRLETANELLDDRDAFLAAWNEAAALFDEAMSLDPTNDDAAENAQRVRPIDP